MKYTSNIPYKTRNILILAMFLIIIAGYGGYHIFYAYPRKLNFFTAEIKKIEQQIQVLDGVEKQFELLQEQIKDEQEKLSNLDKQIVLNVTPASTYSYLNQIIDYAGEFKLDMNFAGSQAGKGYGYNVYNLRGEGYYEKIFDFLWFLERGPQIYKVQSVLFRGVENRNPETNLTELFIPFEIGMRALYADIKDLPRIKRKLGDVRVTKTRNLFYPYVTRDIPRNTENLIEVERAELKAVMPGKAFIVDHNGSVQVLEIGDKVYLGYVTKISPQKNNVEFTLNKGGIVEQYVLELGFDKEVR